MPLIFDDAFRVMQFECDPFDRMSPGGVLRRVQEAGTMHCETLGIDEETYRREHSVFLTSQLSLRAVRMPALYERVKLQTRAYGMKRAVFQRVTSIYAESGEPLCEVDARWVLVDTETRRIMRRTPDFLRDFDDEAGEEGHDAKLPKQDAVPEVMAVKKAVLSLCDRNGHLNNTCYADLMCDLLPPQRMEANHVKNMAVAYRREIPLGSEFEMGMLPMGQNGSYFVAFQDGKKSFEGYVEL